MSFPSSGYGGSGTEDWARAAFAGGGGVGMGLYDNLLSRSVLRVLGQEAPMSEVFELQLPSWLAPSVKAWRNTSTLNASSCEAHSGPRDRAEGAAGVMPAARPDTCSVLFVKSQVSPGGCLYGVRLRRILLPRTVWSLCFLSPVNGETKSEEQGRGLGGDPGTQEPLEKNIKRTI